MIDDAPCYQATPEVAAPIDRQGRCAATPEPAHLALDEMQVDDLYASVREYGVAALTVVSIAAFTAISSNPSATIGAVLHLL
jgi:hypothetical protein